MIDVLSLKRDQDFQTKSNILTQLQKEGFIDQIRAQLRAQVINAMEKEKKSQYGSASKYLQKSEISNPITKKVVEHEDGLLCAELIREFMQFYKMKLSLQIFEPEMSISTGFPKTRTEMEREVGLSDRGDSSKPLLLKLIEQIKYGAGQGMVASAFGSSEYSQGFAKSAVSSQSMWNPNSQKEEFPDPFKKPDPFGTSSLEEKENKPAKKDPKRKRTGDKKKNSKKDKNGDKQNDKTGKSDSASKPAPASQQSLTKLDDLPSLGGKKPVVQQKKDPYDFDLDDLEDDNDDKNMKKMDSKYSMAQKQLMDYEEEENKGYSMKVNAPINQAKNQKKPSNVYDDFVEEEIEEDIQSDRYNDDKNIESSGRGGGFGITVSQSLGIDKSVDSLELDEYDHIEFVEL
eukprot:403360119